MSDCSSESVESAKNTKIKGSGAGFKVCKGFVVVIRGGCVQSEESKA